MALSADERSWTVCDVLLPLDVLGVLDTVAALALDPRVPVRVGVLMADPCPCAACLSATEDSEEEDEDAGARTSPDARVGEPTKLMMMIMIMMTMMMMMMPTVNSSKKPVIVVCRESVSC